MTDTPITSTFPPPPKLEQVKAFIGDLARPFAIIAVSASTSATAIIIAVRVQNLTLESAALFMGALYTGLGALYGAKAWEAVKTGQQSATVAVAQATGSTGAVS